jgi:hypothetical protein
LVIPVEPSAKGQASVAGLESLVAGLADGLDIDIGVLAAVPTAFKDTRDQKQVLEDLDVPTPIVIRERTSLMEGCWRQQCSAFTYVADHRDRIRDYEVDTLAKFDELARYLEREGGIEAPDPPEPGVIDREVTA